MTILGQDNSFYVFLQNPNIRQTSEKVSKARAISQ